MRSLPVVICTHSHFSVNGYGLVQHTFEHPHMVYNIIYYIMIICVKYDFIITPINTQS